MAQRLILPISNCQINAGCKSARYKKEIGYTHYGVDMVERTQSRGVYACGAGTVIACGLDGATEKERMGNVIVMVYPNAELPDGRVLGLSCRMFHLARIACKVGDTVQAGTLLGEYGNTGAHSTGAHLHIEFDTDTNYPAYAVGMAANGRIIKRGSVDSTIDPCKVFWLGGQQSLFAPAQWITEGWVDADSLRLPSDTGSDPQRELERLRGENKRMTKLLQQLHELFHANDLPEIPING